MICLKILLVDDDEDLSAIMRSGIQSAQFHVETAPSVDEALVYLESHHFDIVVSDVQMEPRGGLELLKIVREKYPQTDVIMLTSYGTIDTIINAVKHGAYDFLLKPPELKLVKAALMRCREKRILQSEIANLLRAIKDITLGAASMGEWIDKLRKDMRAMSMDSEHETCRDFNEKILAEMEHKLQGIKLELPKHKKSGD